MSRALAVLIAWLAGCATLEPVPSDTYYRLACPMADGTADVPLSGDSIAVTKFESSGVHKERALVYTDASGISLKQHRYHFWVDSPPELLQECLVRFLREVGASGLVTSDRIASSDLVVSGRVSRFERAVTGDEVIGGITLELSVKRRGSDRPVLVREYHRDALAAGTGVEQSVDALGLAVRDIYTEFVNDLARALADRSVESSQALH